MAQYWQTHTALGCKRVTPDDANDISLPGGHKARAINVATSGVVYVSTAYGTTNEPVYVAAGGWFAIAVTRVYATGTTATGITVGY